MVINIRGYEVIIDDEDESLVSSLSWSVMKSKRQMDLGLIYFHHHIHTSKESRQIRLHRFIMGDPVGMVVDHINRNTLDNRKCNLRIVTQSDNCQNQGLRKDSTTGFKGVSWCNRDKRFIARIYKDGIEYKAGRFKTAIEAHEAYKAKAREVYGEVFAS